MKINQRARSFGAYDNSSDSHLLIPVTVVTDDLLCAYVQFFLGKSITKTRKLKSKGVGQYSQGLLGFSPSLPLEVSGAAVSLGTDDVS